MVIPRARAGAIALVACLALSAGCDSAHPGAGSDATAQGGSAALSGTITVFAAASLSETFTALGHAFEVAHPGTTVRFSFAASSTLAQQIVAGAPADLFASASAENMRQVTAAGDVDPAVTFATNVAEIAVAPASTTKVTSLADLGKAGVRVALCLPQVPCGALALRVLAKAQVAARPVTQGLDVKSTLAYVVSGEVDAAIVYVTDVLAAGNTVRGVEIPAAENARTDYLLATVRASRHPGLAAAFASYLRSPTGWATLSRAGFQQP